jgi:hypothetical protein
MLINLKAKTVPPTRRLVSTINAATRFMSSSYDVFLLTLHQFIPYTAVGMKAA